MAALPWIDGFRSEDRPRSAVLITVCTIKRCSLTGCYYYFPSWGLIKSLCKICIITVLVIKATLKYMLFFSLHPAINLNEIMKSIWGALMLHNTEDIGDCTDLQLPLTVKTANPLPTQKCCCYPDQWVVDGSIRSPQDKQAGLMMSSLNCSYKKIR